MGVHGAFRGVVCVCVCVCQGHTIANKNIQTYNITLQHMTHFITQTHHTNPNRDVPNEFCVLRNKSLSRERKQPTFSVYSCKHGRRRSGRARRRQRRWHVQGWFLLVTMHFALLVTTVVASYAAPVPVIGHSAPALVVTNVQRERTKARSLTCVCLCAEQAS